MTGHRRLKVLFLCTGHACRSQIAEGWCRSLRSDRIEASSAGTEPRDVVDPLAVKVMSEVGVDITGARPRLLDLREVSQVDIVVTLCERAAEQFKAPSGVKVVHVPFEDPPRLAESSRTEAEALVHYRRVRNEIRSFVEELPESLAPKAVEAAE